MNKPTRVGLRQPVLPPEPAGALTAALGGPPAGPRGQPLLAPQGAAVILGGSDPLSAMVQPARDTLFGPRGATLLAPAGPLWVADTGHHRLLGWAQRPQEDGEPANWVLGQPDFDREGRNALGEASARTCNVPSGIARCGRGLALADSWNNRVLIWHELPEESGVPADVVLGQADFTGQDPNRGRTLAESGAAGPDTMHWPFAVLHAPSGELIVADAGNRRVLIWQRLPSENGQPADVVLGQADFASRSDNGGQDPGWNSFRYPHDLGLLDGDLVVADAGNNRVLRFQGIPGQNNLPASSLVGQPNQRAVDHNQGRYWPIAAAVNMPYALTTGSVGGAEALIVADTANSRLLSWPAGFQTGVEALGLAGQPHFHTKGDNRWGETERDSLCWPYGLDLCDTTLVVADTGNHRVLLWDLA